MSEELLKADEIKLKVLTYLKKDEKWHSYYDLQKSLGINYESLKQHMRFLEKLGLVELQIIEPDESKTGKGSYNVLITKRGKEVVEE